MNRRVLVLTAAVVVALVVAGLMYTWIEGAEQGILEGCRVVYRDDDVSVQVCR